jgi:apolipoprotein N-acyltransferase
VSYRGPVPRLPSPAPAFVRAGVGLVSGLLTALAFPTHDVWWLAPVGVALLSAAVLGTRWRLAALVGLAHGLGFFVPTLSWSGIYVGRVPWFALATLEALYIALMCAVTTLVQRPLTVRGWRPLAFAAVPLAWVLQEWARGTTPFGGFPWARLAFSQADGPLLPLARYAGAPGLTFTVAAVGVLLHVTLAAGAGPLRRSSGGLPRAAGRTAHVPALLVPATLVVAALVPVVAAVATTPPSDGRRVPVLFVQGNVPEPGLEFNAERRKVLDNHVQGTLGAVAQGPTPSLVVWPENSSDIDPLRNADADAAIRAAVDGVGAPVLVGAVLTEPAPYLSNASLFYRPGGGEPEQYVKQHPVPFAEYIPYRSFFRRFSDKVDLVSRDFTQGDRPGGFEVPMAGQQPYWIIPTICFEVAYDDLMRDSTMQPGRSASVLAVQTNNATFGFTAESEQQFAISRVRAVEHGRSIVHVSTVGVSGFVAPDGSASGTTSLFTPAARYGDPVVRTETTPSDRLGRLPEYAAALALLALALLAVAVRPRGVRVEATPGTAPERSRRDGVVV